MSTLPEWRPSALGPFPRICLAGLSGKSVRTAEAVLAVSGSLSSWHPLLPNLSDRAKRSAPGAGGAATHSGPPFYRPTIAPARACCDFYLTSPPGPPDARPRSGYGLAEPGPPPTRLAAPGIGRGRGPPQRQIPMAPIPSPYSAARNSGYTFARAASFAGKALALAQGAPQVLGPPRAPTPSSRVPDREGRAAAPPRTLPRTVRSRADCRPSYAPHSKSHLLE
jgi:hypothetical protein